MGMYLEGGSLSAVSRFRGTGRSQRRDGLKEVVVQPPAPPVRRRRWLSSSVSPDWERGLDRRCAGVMAEPLRVWLRLGTG